MSAPQQGNGKKLVFVGDSGVGKTCIITRFLKESFNPNELTTDGASYANKTIEIPEMKEYITFDIWDTAGQEQYRALTKFFFQGAKMAILVYDITVRQSYDNLKDDWYKQIQDYADSDIVIGIAGNKSDLYDDEAVPEQEAREFAKSIGAIFSLTSAQNNSGINELFINLGRKYLDPNFIPGQNPNPNPQPNPQPKSRKEPEKNNNIVIGKPKKDDPKPRKCC